MSEEPRKRSRFDQTEADPPRKSRFDRRSRSPANKPPDASRRSRSPVLSPASEAGKRDAADKAAAAAAKINASLTAKRGPQHVDVPPIRSNPSPGAVEAGGTIKSPTENAKKSSGTLNDDIYQQDGDYIRDIEVNDLRNRYTLTKGSTQKMIKDKTGADVTTRGNYYPDKTMATPANPPLYLHITSTSKDGLEKAVAEIEELMKQDLPNLIDERRFRPRREPERDNVERDSLGRRKWPEERIPIDLEPIPGFNLRAQVVGAGGAYVKHIQQETRCRVQIKGRGSGFIEHDTGHESDEQMYLHVAGPDAGDVQEAKNQCLDLLNYVKTNYEEYKNNRNQRHDRGYGGDQRGGYGGPRDRNGSNSYGGGSHYGGGSSYGGQSQYGGGYGQGTPNPADGAYGGYGGAQSPPQAQAQQQQQAAAGQQQQMSPEQMQAWAQYYAANPDQDPYAAYGGFGVAMQYYMGQQQQAAPPAPPQQASPPPPPPPPGV